jgi:hypothetical protein
MKTQHGVSSSGDLADNTWTFEMDEPVTLVAGDFSIMSRFTYERMIKQIERMAFIEEFSKEERKEFIQEAFNLIKEVS